MACNDLQSLHQHTVLVVCDRHCLICRTGPPECTIIESFVHKEKTIAFPEQCFDPVTSSSTEKKQCIFVVRIKLKLKAYDRCQSIDPTTEIRKSGLSTHKDKPDYKHEIFILIFLLKALF